MSSLESYNIKTKTLGAPEFVRDDLIYLTVTGSKAVGTSTVRSDTDMLGICIPPKEKVFPVFGGYIEGFGAPVKAWDRWGYIGIDLDIQVYSVVKFFYQAMKGNPQMIEALYTDDQHVPFISELGVSLKGSRSLFISDKMIHSHTGFYLTSRDKMFDYVAPDDVGAMYDRQAAYHSARLLLNMEQIFETGTLSLSKYATLLTKIRDGLFKADELKEYLEEKLNRVLILREDSNLNAEPNQEYIKMVLVDLLETHWNESLDFL